ncbi:MAG: ABC transporter ATP-binding protein [Spirochaetales bacterium]|nr:ABC transporter ATP-binding protein [Spirochaetales bacterium]
MSLLEISSIKKTYETGTESVEVLKDINLTAEEGTVIVITGESGSGKSTLLNLIGGIDSPTSGEIKVKNLIVTGKTEKELTHYRNKFIGFIFQFHFLLKDFTALENVMMPAIISGDNSELARQKASRLLGDVGLSQRNNHFFLQLSGGERQRVAVARALMNDPDLIIADEPTGNLDERNSGIVQDILFDMVKKYNKTMLLVTHDTAMAQRGDIHLILEHGVLTEK